MAMKKKNLPEVVPELFEHEEFGQFRFIKRGEEIWFVAVDVCRALDIQNVRQNLAEFPDDEKGVCSIYTPGGPQKMNIVSEPGFYRLIFMSRKPEAEKIKRWVFHEVLPSIRKYGYYSMDEKNFVKLPHFETDEEWFEYYELLKRQVPYMSDEEVMKLSEDPDVLVYKKTRLTKEEILEWSKNPDAFNHKKNDSKWQVRFLLI